MNRILRRLDASDRLFIALAVILLMFSLCRQPGHVAPAYKNSPFTSNTLTWNR